MRSEHDQSPPLSLTGKEPFFQLARFSHRRVVVAERWNIHALKKSEAKLELNQFQHSRERTEPVAQVIGDHPNARQAVAFRARRSGSAKTDSIEISLCQAAHFLATGRYPLSARKRILHNPAPRTRSRNCIDMDSTGIGTAIHIYSGNRRDYQII